MASTLFIAASLACPICGCRFINTSLCGVRHGPTKGVTLRRPCLRPFGSKGTCCAICTQRQLEQVTGGGVHVTVATHEPRAVSTTTREGMGKQHPLVGGSGLAMTHAKQVPVPVRAQGKLRLLNRLRPLQVVGMAACMCGRGCACVWSRGLLLRQASPPPGHWLGPWGG